MLLLRAQSHTRSSFRQPTRPSSHSVRDLRPTAQGYSCGVVVSCIDPAASGCIFTCASSQYMHLDRPREPVTTYKGSKTQEEGERRRRGMAMNRSNLGLWAAIRRGVWAVGFDGSSAPHRMRLKSLRQCARLGNVRDVGSFTCRHRGKTVRCVRCGSCVDVKRLAMEHIAIEPEMPFRATPSPKPSVPESIMSIRLGAAEPSGRDQLPFSRLLFRAARLG